MCCFQTTRKLEIQTKYAWISLPRGLVGYSLVKEHTGELALPVKRLHPLFAFASCFRTSGPRLKLLAAAVSPSRVANNIAGDWLVNGVSRKISTGFSRPVKPLHILACRREQVYRPLGSTSCNHSHDSTAGTNRPARSEKPFRRVLRFKRVASFNA